MPPLLQAFLQPTTITVAIALLLAFYLVWALARQHYLGVYQQFDILAISLSAGIVSAFLAQLVYPSHLSLPWPPDRAAQALSQPFTIVALFAAYLGSGLATWRYIRRIHYPYWRVMDVNVLGLSLVALGWMAGIIVQQYSIPLVVGTIFWAIICAILLIAYHRVDRPGVTVGLHLASMWLMVIGLQYALVSWQGNGSIVEYALATTAALVGLGVVILRLGL